MISSAKIFVIICLCTICALPVYSSASLPMVPFTLKSPGAEGPYQDQEFLEKANMSIYALSNTTVPNGTTLREVQSVQMQLSKMKVSPELYPVANNINSFLYYTGKAGDAFSESSSMTESQFSPVSQSNAMTDEANMYYSAAKAVWERVKYLYPDVTLYTMTGGSDAPSYSTGSLYSPVSGPHGAYSGLW